MNKRFALSLLFTAALAGCSAVGPDYQRPAAVADARFISAGATAVNTQAPAADIATFWRGFNDARLSALIERALQANGDVRIAQARLQEARANQGEADAAGLPGVGIDTSVERSVRPITQQPGTTRSARTGTAYDASFVANWEIDLFGGVRRSREAAAARVSASEAGLSAAHTAVAAEVARYYLELRGLQERLRVTQASLVNQRDALGITNARVDNGRGTQLDLARARGLVASTEAAVPSLQTAIERSVFRLATLTAQTPRSAAGRAERTRAAARPARDRPGHAARGHDRAVAAAPARPDRRRTRAGRGHRQHRRGHRRAVPAPLALGPARPERGAHR